MKNWKVAMCLIALAIAGCTETEKALDADCGVGDNVAYDGDIYCVYRSNITEEGFSCPPAYRHETELSGGTLCSSSEELSAAAREHFRKYAEAWNVKDDVGFLDVGISDGGSDTGSVDLGSSDTGTDTADVALPLKDCECRPGEYAVAGEGFGAGGSPFSVNYTMEITEMCGADPVCTIDGTERRCFVQAENFRIYLDMDGYVQLIFSGDACEEPWTGNYATQGGNAQVEAIRVTE